MFRNVLIILILITLAFTLGCENHYYDARLKMEVQQLDSDLENRWSTSGVVVSAITSNGPADKAELSSGELISYVIGEYPVSS